MKRAVIILAAICASCLGALVAIFIHSATKQESDKNKDKTAAARAARWAKPEPEMNVTPDTTVKEAVPDEGKSETV